MVTLTLPSSLTSLTCQQQQTRPLQPSLLLLLHLHLLLLLLVVLDAQQQQTASSSRAHMP
jgi:hypothetical protein